MKSTRLTKYFFSLIGFYFFLFALPAFSIDSTELQSQEMQSMLLCPQVTMNNVILTATPQDVPLTSTITCTEFEAGKIAWVLGAIGAHFEYECPPEFPYLGSIIETWGGPLWAGGGGTMKVSCCQSPQPTKAATSVWVRDTVCP